MVVGNFPLADKVAIVTGGGSGICLAFVRLVVAANAKCLIADLQLTAEAEALVKQHPTQLAFVKCDVANWKDLEAIPEQVRQAFGSDAVADVWVAGAGIFEPPWSSFLHDTEQDSYKTMRINAEHPIKLTRIAMRCCLGANKPAVVLIVASGAGLVGAYGAPLYCASKHAVVGFTKSMAAADVEENIKVVAVCPGIVDTPLWSAEGIGKQYGFSAATAIRAEDVAQVMKELVEEGQYPGGTLLSTTTDNLRKVVASERRFEADNPEARAMLEDYHAPMKAVYNAERHGQK